MDVYDADATGERDRVVAAGSCWLLDVGWVGILLSVRTRNVFTWLRAMSIESGEQMTGKTGAISQLRLCGAGRRIGK